MFWSYSRTAWPIKILMLQLCVIFTLSSGLDLNGRLIQPFENDPWSIVWDLILYWAFEKMKKSFSLAFHLNIWDKKYVFILGGKIIFILWKCFDALMYLNVYSISCNLTFSLWMRNNYMKWNKTSIYFDSHMNFRNDFVKQAEAWAEVCDCLFMFIRLVSDIERNCNLWK